MLEGFDLAKGLLEYGSSRLDRSDMKIDESHKMP